MNRHYVAFTLLLAILTESGAGAQDSKKPKGKEAGPKDLKLALTKVAIKKGTQRMGWGLKGDPPIEAWQAKFPKPQGASPAPSPESIYLYDLDGNGTIDPDTDGMAFPGIPFIVPLPKILLLRIGQFKVSFESLKTLVLSADDLGPAQKYVADAAVFTELRVRSGLMPVPLDKDLCVACEKHCDYLKANGLTDGKGGRAVYTEESGKPGYSDEGLEAAKVSNIGCTSDSVHKFILDAYTAFYMRVPMVNPKLGCFGVSSQNGVNMLHVAKQDGFQDALSVHPADGQIGTPRFFTSNGESPNPVPGSEFAKGCGFAIMVRLVAPYKELQSAEVLDPKGKKVAGTFSSPAKPANQDWPDNNNCAGFIPSKSLEPNTTYRVTFQFAEEKAPISWSFTTAEK
jgi:hypothetical protein